MKHCRKPGLCILFFVIALFIAQGTLCAAEDESLWGDESLMTRFLSAYYQVDPITVISLGQRMTLPDDVPVAIYLAKSAGIPPLDLLKPRLNSESWLSIADGLGIDPSVLFTLLDPKARIPAEFSHAYGEYAKHLKNPGYTMVLYDKEFRNLIQLKLVSDAFKKPPLSVMSAITGGETFTSLILNELEKQRRKTTGR